MQLLKITLYNSEGETRGISFRPGQLNIVTGDSGTGKSTLLSIVDFCFGNDNVALPRSPQISAIEWFGTLWQFADGSRVFLARRKRGQGSPASGMMMKFGGRSMGDPSFEALGINATSSSARSAVGEKLGLSETKLQPTEHSMRAFSVTLGSAAFLCFQEQSEVANKYQLFHRQGDEGIKEHIRDTLPYFLGAVEGDQASKRQELREVRRALRRVEARLQQLEASEREIEASLQALLIEAFAAGLTKVDYAPSSAIAIELLANASRTQATALAANADTASQDARHQLESERDDLRMRLREILDNRDLLIEQRAGMDNYGRAVGLQTSRLASLDLLKSTVEPTKSAARCPVCSGKLSDSDPTALQMSHRLASLRDELDDLAASNPVTAEAKEMLDTSAAEARARLTAIDSALRTLNGEDDFTASDAENRAFVRGRIDATLNRQEELDAGQKQKLEREKTRWEVQVARLEADLSDDSVLERLNSKLFQIGRDMTRWAKWMNLEHAENGVRIDLNKMTVVAETEPVPTLLAEIGSAANWVGYHLVAHLALHRHFTKNRRPVPRLLMIDQPTQAFYGRAKDKKKVNDIFKLSKAVADELAPDMQIIIVDHVNLKKKSWFQSAVVHDWENEALVPKSWFEDASATKSPTDNSSSH